MVVPIVDCRCCGFVVVIVVVMPPSTSIFSFVKLLLFSSYEYRRCFVVNIIAVAVSCKQGLCVSRVVGPVVSPHNERSCEDRRSRGREGDGGGGVEGGGKEGRSAHVSARRGVAGRENVVGEERGGGEGVKNWKCNVRPGLCYPRAGGGLA